jgi:shikimate dehydrogenase
MPSYGLIGYPLTHSWSAKFFNEKFERLGLKDHSYHLYPLPEISGLRTLIRSVPGLRGLNVTIPHKVAVLSLLDETDEEALKIGAVNCIRISQQNGDIFLSGHNTDVYGFRETLLPLIHKQHHSALVLGTGGASRAVCYVLEQSGINYRLVSRNPEGASQIDYSDLTKEILDQHLLIIQTTPLGMYPQIDTCPDIPYHYLNHFHLLIDLVYNPVHTLFMQKGLKHGATVVNGLKMLELQAEEAWRVMG